MDRTQIEKALKSLQRHGEVKGTLATKGNMIIYECLPINEDGRQRLADLVHDMIDGYHQVSRNVRFVIMSWESMNILVYVAESANLAILFKERDECDFILTKLANLGFRPKSVLPPEKSSSRLTARVRLIRWKDVAVELERILSEVFNPRRANIMLQQEVKACGIDPAKSVSLPLIHKFTSRLLDHVSSKPQQKQLQEQLRTFFSRIE